MDLSSIKTCNLVAELRKREGVQVHDAGSYEDVQISANGPAVILVVTD